MKAYFLLIVNSSKKLMKPEMKQHLEDFELKVNLDENAMLELKQNNPLLNMKEELARIKKSKKQARGGLASQAPDVEMDGNGAPPQEGMAGPRRRTRQEFDKEGIAEEDEVMEASEKIPRNKNVKFKQGNKENKED